MGLAYVVVGIVSAAVAVFAVQNSQSMALRFLNWSFADVPLAGALLGALVAGFVLSAIPLSIAQWRWRARARALESKIDMLEAALATRESNSSLLTPRPAAPAPVARTA
ncbi:MAG: LapA family protein [Candidatus Rokubacteria bacterium]|nr:LapA family protein [Candidatus Rokubacteria bacterium]